MKRLRMVMVLLMIVTVAHGQKNDVGKNQNTEGVQARNVKRLHYHDNGELASEGQYELGFKIGKWTYWHENGKMSSQGEYDLYGKKKGNWEFLNEKGIKTSEGQYEKDLKTGIWTYWDSLGYKISTGGYLEDSKQGKWQYFYIPSGEKREEGVYVEGVRKGEWITWFQNGQERERCDCDQRVYRDKSETVKECLLMGQYDSLGSTLVENGNGNSIYFYDGGSIKKKGAVRKGRKEDSWEYYTPEGRLEAIDRFQQGRLVSGISYDSLGQEYTYEQFYERSNPVEGLQSFYQFIREHLKYPEQAETMGIEGKVLVRFEVYKDGSINNIEVVRGIGESCDAEAIRVVELASDNLSWVPGKERGQKVKSKIILPISFKLG